MSKELVISAASHERRVAILEEGQLVEIYIEREKEFALVGSIYKGRVTRVLPGMQSAFVDIGLDGDAFLYVSDVFENLEDYDHGHGQAEPHAQASATPPAAIVDVLPGETLGHAHGTDEVTHEVSDDAAHHDVEHEHQEHDEIHHEARHEAHDEDVHAGESSHEDHASAGEEHPAEAESHEHHEAHAEAPEERQPESNASAPQNFAHQYNPTQKYPPRSDRGSDRGGERNDRGPQGGGRGGDRGGDRGRGGRWGRRGGRNRGGRPQGSSPGGRNLPPSKYASPQGGEQRPQDSRGFEPRGQQPRGFEPRGPEQRGFDNRRPERSESPRHSGPSTPGDVAEEPILLPGESLAKYRNKPTAAAAPSLVEQETREPEPEVEETTPRASAAQPASTPSATNVPRRSSGGLPRWLLAETGPEVDASNTGTEELAGAAEDTSSAIRETSAAQTDAAAEPARVEVPLSDEETVALSSGLAEAKHEETQAEAEADALVGGAEFDEEDDAEEESEAHAEEIHASEDIEVEVSDEQAEQEEHETVHSEARDFAEAEAEAAHDDAIHGDAVGEHAPTESAEHEVLAAAAGGEHAAEPAVIEEDVILLPGETRSPRIAGSPAAPREDFPRDSARIGGNPRARFQRPFRSGGGRDRGRDSRGGRGGRPDQRGGRPPGRFERRPSGPGGPRPDRGHQGGHSGPSRRPQLISEMLKAGQDVVIQIAKEPLGKKGARITSHVALPGRFLVYMPTVHHTGVSRKIISADNRSRLRRLVSEAGNAYPGGFIVRTAAGDATDEEIRTDIEFLGKTWNEIKERSEQRKSPALLHRDLDLVERMLRDYVSDDFTAIWIDNEEEYGKVVEFVSRFQPKLVTRVKLYTKETPIFEEFGIQHELDKALRAKVWLKSGGYIVINHTEALVAIDVNTGKFVGKGSTRLEDTIVKTNLEAVKEIVRQIRLRDLGGIIVVDFIDMEERRNREKVLGALQQALEQDKAPSKALSFNEFGLVCITRKRTKQALERVLCQPCPYCTGSGMVKSVPTLCYEIQAEARKMAAADRESPNLTLRVNPEIAKALKTRESMLMDELEQTTHKHIIIQSDATLHWEQYDIY
jgi:Rne/Rng family ribonuclease